jgi:hypothetical protein
MPDEEGATGSQWNEINRRLDLIEQKWMWEAPSVGFDHPFLRF